MDLVVIKNKILTKKNIILFAIIFILMIIVVSLLFILNNKDIQLSGGSTTFSSDDYRVSITIANKYDFEKTNDESYILSLRSKKTSSNILISSVSTDNIRDLNKFIDGDKNDYISKFPNISNVSDITQTSINGLTAYNYNFYYKSNMFVDVYWILKDDKLYAVDINTNTDDDDFFSNRLEILNTLVID